MSVMYAMKKFALTKILQTRHRYTEKELGKIIFSINFFNLFLKQIQYISHGNKQSQSHKEHDTHSIYRLFNFLFHAFSGY